MSVCLALHSSIELTVLVSVFTTLHQESSIDYSRARRRRFQLQLSVHMSRSSRSCLNPPAFKPLKEGGSNSNEKRRAGAEIRMRLLDSFLDELLPDLTTFFGKGDLVIIDLSDPFMAGMRRCLNRILLDLTRPTAVNAALLFDIALDLFIEWKTSTGKIIGRTVPPTPSPHNLTYGNSHSP